MLYAPIDAFEMDTSFFVKAFAASTAAVVPGYVIGGIAYFAVPWCLGTLMSFVAIGLEGDPRFPTFPRVCCHPPTHLLHTDTQ